MSRTLFLSCLAATLVAPAVAPSVLYAMPGKDKKGGQGQAQTDSTVVNKARKAKTGQATDDDNDGKKKLKPRAVPNTPPPAEARPQDDDAGSQPWDTDFLVRNSIPAKRGIFILASY